MMSPLEMIPTTTPFSMTGRRLTFISSMDDRTSMIVVSGVVVRTVRVMMSETRVLEISSETLLRIVLSSRAESMG